MKTTFLVLQFFFILLMLATLLPLVVRARQAKRSQDEIVRSLQDEGATSWFRIYVSRPAQFARRMKIVGFEGRGVLVNLPDRVRVIADLPRGVRIDRTLAGDDLGLRWIGNPGIGSANLHWIGIGHGENELMISADTGFNAVKSREATADICRMIAPNFRLPEVARSEFALEKNPASLAVVAGFFAVLAFALLDGMFLNQNELLKPGNVVWGMPTLVLFALPCYWLLTRSQVPSRESMTLSMLVFMALMAAYLPALKRVDQWLADDGPQSYEYVLKSGATFESVASGPPPLNFRRAKEYWAQFDAGSTHRFDLIHGPLGMWQLDPSKLTPEFRAFYEKRDGK